MVNQSIKRNTLIEAMERIFDQVPIPFILVDQVKQNRSEAARVLGISRSNLYTRLKKYNL